MTIKCPICVKDFNIKPYRLKRTKRQICCSPTCRVERARKLREVVCQFCKQSFDAKYTDKRRKFCSKRCYGLANRGENNYLWKGDRVSYNVLHKWVAHRLGGADHCKFCGMDKIPNGKQRYFHWANISGNYKRELDDWIQLCYKCHFAFDREFHT